LNVRASRLLEKPCQLVLDPCVDGFTKCPILGHYFGLALSNSVGSYSIIYILKLKISMIYNSTAYSALFPFSSSHVLSLSGYIPSLLSMIMGCSVGELTYLHLHLYPHMTNLTDRCSFPYLANFMDTVSGLALSNSVASCSVIYIFHLKLFSSTIPPQTPRTHKLHSTKVQKCFKLYVVAFHPH
jgi:hypothetical protein